MHLLGEFSCNINFYQKRGKNVVKTLPSKHP